MDILKIIGEWPDPPRWLQIPIQGFVVIMTAVIAVLLVGMVLTGVWWVVT